MIEPEVRRTAAQCRHYAMCKIDFLGTGLCPAGRAKHYVSYYPQGRMDLCDALARNLIPITERLIDIVATCNLCGLCDRQCYFVTGLRPMKVMRALKAHVEARGKGNAKPTAEKDPVLDHLQGIVGKEWATKDPAILVTYADDPFPLAGRRMPAYVVLPESGDEIAAIVKLSRKHSLPYVVRGNGGSVFGFVFTDGIVMDTTRMKKIEIDADNWTAAAEAGVTSFDLQREALKRGCRVNAAEPAATACGNLVCTGTFSTWTNIYGTGADNIVDAEFVSEEGKIFRLNDKQAPNLFAFRHEVSSPPGICTRAWFRLHPVLEDEEGALVPFGAFEEAVSFARNLSQRRIGGAVGVLGGHYLATFMSPSAELSRRIRPAVEETLGIRYAVLVTGDRFVQETIRKMRPAIIDNRMLRAFMLGLPNLAEKEWTDLIRQAEGDKLPFEVLCRQEMVPILEAVLAPSVKTIAGAVDEDLREFYAGLYERPEMTDILWLNTCRIVSSRMSRHKHMFAFLVYVPLDRIEVIEGIVAGLARIADRQGLEHDYGFLTPLDLGKRGILEYDYYLDHTDEEERKKVQRAMEEFEPFLEDLGQGTKGVKWLKYVFAQGCSRKEHFLYT